MSEYERALPVPPPEFRAMVGPQDQQDYDNPTGAPIYPELPPNAYRSVFDFGCGCGRLARQLIQQEPRPRRYMGVDPNRDMVQWASANLSPRAPGFEFLHHDVYSPGYSPNNSLRLSAPLPMEDGGATLFIAHSVFTHLSQDQAAYYLSELRRILAKDGIALTTWFFFDAASTPFLQRGPYALYADPFDFAAAVIFDRRWFLAAVQQLGLAVRRTVPPRVPGHQWAVWLERRTADSVDHFPTGEEWSEHLCGATLRPRAAAPSDSELLGFASTGSRWGRVEREIRVNAGTPGLSGPLAELALYRRFCVSVNAARRLVRWLRRLRS